MSVELYYYSPFSPKTDNTVLVVKIKGHGSNTLTGRQWWHPRTKKQLDAYYATEPRPEYPQPSYVVIDVNGQVDVIEHRAYAQQNREPTRALFWMTDDPAILQEGRDSRSKAETLR